MIIKLKKRKREEVLFTKYQRLAKSAAAAISSSSKLPYSELEGQALDILARLLVEQWETSYDPKRGVKAGTWIYTKVYFNLLNWTKARFKTFRRERPIEDGEMEEPWTPRKQKAHRVPVAPEKGRLQRIFDEVNEEGRALLQLICEAPGDLAYALSPSAPARSMNALRRYVSDELEWTEDQIFRGWTSLEHSVLTSPL